MKQLTENEKILLDALRDAVTTIEAWHGMTSSGAVRFHLWQLYYLNAPEMKKIRDVFYKMGVEFDEISEKPNPRDPKLF